MSVEDQIKSKVQELRLALLTRAAKYVTEIDGAGCLEDLERYASVLYQLDPDRSGVGAYGFAKPDETSTEPA